MTTLNTRKIDGVFQPEVEDEAYNPFSEYDHVKENYTASSSTPQQETKELQSKQELFDGIDKVFEGANFVFDIFNHVSKHLNRRR